MQRFTQSLSSGATAILLLMLSAGTVTVPMLPQSAAAIERADGTVYFARPPRLLGASTPRNSAAATRVMYYFTLEVPEDAGEPLEKVDIDQQQGLVNLRFDLSRSRAFSGTPRNKGEAFNIAAANQTEKRGSISLVFDPPIPPGETVTVGLRSRRNPRGGGVYLFGITAFPAAEKAHGQFIGFGRLHFFDNRDDFFRL